MTDENQADQLDTQAPADSAAPEAVDAPEAPESAPEAPAEEGALDQGSADEQAPATPASDAAPEAPAAEPAADEYVAPVITDLSAVPEDVAALAPVAAVVAAAVAANPATPTVDAVEPGVPNPSDDPLNPSTITGDPAAPSFEQGQDVIGLNKMTNAKGNAATVIIFERIERHMLFVSGKRAFADLAAREQEQESFIESVGNMMRLPYDEYVLVTNQLLTAIKKNIEAFEDGTAYRFIAGLDKKIPKDTLNAYRAYMHFLYTVASNWSARSRLDKKIDIASVVGTFPAKIMKENVVRYYREIVAQ